MKRILFVLTALTFSLAILAQGNSGGKGNGKDKQNNEAASDQTGTPGNSDKGKGKDKEKQNKEKKEKEDKDRKEKAEHENKVWDGTNDNGGKGPKPSKNQPAKVREAFQRDYPNATNVYWTKYRGDWTATFGNGVFRSTAVYHANGERRDTRTPVLRDKMPKSVLDSIFKRRPDTRLDEAIKIEVPKAVKDIFRIKNVIEGKPAYEYYDADGKLVQYNY